MIKVAIIDGFSSGKFIARGLHDKGCELVHVFSSDKLDDYYYNGFDYSIYSQTIVHKDMATTLEFIKAFNAEYVVAGTESGVTLSDSINSQLQLFYRNSSENTSSRRNKLNMIETVRDAGLNAAEQIQISCFNDATEWLGTQDYPVVLKPLESAGSDGVFICQCENEVKEAFNRIYKKINKLNLHNDMVLLQEFLKGIEYVVNFVFLNGFFIPTEVVRYHKRKLETGNIVYDIDEIIDAASSEFELLVDYTAQVCKCLGIKNGPSHAEVMMTKKGPYLVEIAARSDGILRPDISLHTTGLGQLAATILSITEPESFIKLTRMPYYKLKNHSFNVCLISPRSGVFRSKDLEALTHTLPSLKKVELYLSSGSTVSKTIDIFSQPGTIYLVSPDKEKLWQDYKIIRQAESLGIYVEEI